MIVLNSLIYLVAKRAVFSGTSRVKSRQEISCSSRLRQYRTIGVGIGLNQRDDGENALEYIRVAWDFESVGRLSR